MLRFEYMPSDFHPLFLFLGEASDLAALAGLLRRFAENPQAVAVAEQIPGAVSRNALVLAPATRNSACAISAVGLPGS